MRTKQKRPTTQSAKTNLVKATQPAKVRAFAARSASDDFSAKARPTQQAARRHPRGQSFPGNLRIASTQNKIKNTATDDIFECRMIIIVVIGAEHFVKRTTR